MDAFWLTVVPCTYIIAALIFFKAVDKEKDWHNVPKKILPFFYVSLAIALCAHIISVAWLLTICRGTDLTAVGACAMVYVILCVLWLPLARIANNGKISKWWVRALLAAAACPLVYIAILAFDKTVVLGALASTAAVHAIIMDAFVYGLLF